MSYAENALPAVLPQASQTDDLAKALGVTPQQGTAPIALPEAKQLEIKENGDPLEPYFNGFDEGRTGEPLAEAAGQSGAQVQGAALGAAGVRQDADVNAALSGQRAGELAEGAESTAENLKPQYLMDELEQSGVKYNQAGVKMKIASRDYNISLIGKLPILPAGELTISLDSLRKCCKKRLLGLAQQKQGHLRNI